MNKLDIIIPVINEAESIGELTQRIDHTMRASKIDYGIIFVDDHSTDATVEEIKKASNKYPIRLHIKEGKKGKAYSVLEGAKLSKAKYLAMIDGDLQYPPEVLSKMFALVKQHGMVVANRNKYSTSFFRRIISKANSLIFGKLILGFDCDVQSGLKMFKREIIDHLQKHEVKSWTIDMNLLRTAIELGYNISHVEIDFVQRQSGRSKIHFLKDSWQIGSSAVGLRFRKRKVYKIKSHANESVIGAGVAHKKCRFITHTHLPHHQSALRTFQTWQKLALLLIMGIAITGLVINVKTTAIVMIATLSLIYFVDLIFSLYVLLKSLHFPPEIKANASEIKKLKNEKLPIYSILCPLYKEAAILPHFLEAIEAIDWPKDKLDCLLLLEEDDKETQEAAEKLNLPSYIRTLIVPHSKPKTKPKACNYGLAHVKGEYVVIYDAEDKPDPLQLKKSYLAFSKLDKKVCCLQSKLNYYNKDQNLLTRFFTAEYSLWFDLILPGLQSIEAIIPLGGTSNHFRTKELRGLHGWDSFNVTEDCDLGVRLFKAGYRTALIDSTTYEEANSKVGSWLRQRSRWIKGYLQTYLVHMRNPISFARSHGVQALIFQLVIGMRMIFMLINPILWLATISYFTAYSLIGPAIEALYPAPVFYVAVTSLVFGNFVYLYNYMIGCAKRGHWSVIKFVFLVPLYWLMTSIAATIAFYQLFTKPHYWEKTSHGLHIKKAEKKRIAQIARTQAALARKERLGRLRGLAANGMAAGGFLITASIIANFFNFLYNAYLGRSVSLAEFGTVSVISNIFLLVGVVTSAVGKSVTYKSAHLLGKYKEPIKEFLTKTRKWILPLSLLAVLAWLILTPFLAKFFNLENILPFFLFTPVWLVVLAGSVNSGFLTGNLKFTSIAVISLVEAISKLALAIALVETGFPELVYAAIPASVIISFLAGWFAVSRVKTVELSENLKTQIKFPIDFFATCLLTNFAAVAFLSLDVILAKHYLAPQAAGEYALLSLSGKMVFFAGSLFVQFINPLVSRHKGAGKDAREIFYKLLMAVMFTTLVGFTVVGIFGHLSIPALFGSRANPIVYLLPIYTMAMVGFVIGGAFTVYHQVNKQYLFAYVSFFAALTQVLAIMAYHDDVYTIALITAGVGFVYLILTSFFHFTYATLVVIARNIADFFGLFGRVQEVSNGKGGKLKILIFNWRDTKHTWAGGAEVYIHELAKQWVVKNHQVTLFCGNDGKSERNEVVDGIQVVRRGGFYTVYLWAAFYYILRFRGHYDVIVDCENGIPFFTPLYARIPKFLMIYHVHQEVFMENLKPPFSWTAMFLEAKLMPFLYKNSKVVTISESSKKAIMKHGLAKRNPSIIYGGVDLEKFTLGKKAETPLILYLGRLKPYKNLPVLIKAFGQIVQKIPEARLVIAGFGESRKSLEQLARDLKIEKSIKFEGMVSEKRKVELYQKAWVVVNPSTMEGWGITSIEANACGTAIVASDVPGLRDSVKNFQSGFLVEHDNSKAFADCIFRLITNHRLRKDLSISARNWAAGFSWENSANNFLALFALEQNKKDPRMCLKQQLETA
jgi:cellulose synthase/poly-beta-1,6-N-acetylglucosamine synthase-like glycosyltransferase/glycosyltransferase involved in cell wall biosynthesis/O-antigen/teichoic acid export membrane protein